MSKGFKIFLGILGVFILACIVIVISFDNETATTKKLEPKTEKKPSDILRFRIVGKKDVSYLNTPRIVYRVVLDIEEVPNKESMRKTAMKIWEKGNKDWKEFTVFMYLPEMNTESTAYGIGSFTPKGITEFQMMDIALLGTKWEETYLKDEKKRIDKAKEELALKRQDKRVQEYHVNLDVIEIESRKIRIGINTNFPNGTNFHVSVVRIYHEKGSSASYAGDIFGEDIPIENGKIQVEVYIDDSKWYNKYYEDAKNLGHLADYPGVGQISPKIEVRVMFSPRRKQSDEVLKILGTNGEFVGGEGAEKRGTFTTYSVTRLVNILFQK